MADRKGDNDTSSTQNPIPLEKMLPVVKKHLLHREPMLDHVVYEGTPQQQDDLRRRIEAFPLDACVTLRFPTDSDGHLVHDAMFEAIDRFNAVRKYLFVREDTDGAVAISPYHADIRIPWLRTREEGLLLPDEISEPVNLVHEGIRYRIYPEYIKR